MTKLSFDEWVKEGYLNGWVGPPVCYTHDGLPLSETENSAFDEGEDPCLHIVRLYEDAEHKKQVEEEHSPSQWRASNSGLTQLELDFGS